MIISPYSIDNPYRRAFPHEGYVVPKSSRAEVTATYRALRRHHHSARAARLTVIGMLRAGRLGSLEVTK